MRSAKCRGIRLIAFLCLFAGLVSLFSAAARAEGYTQETAVAYAKSLIGSRIDVDNGSYDCVDIAKEYFKVVGGKAYTSLTALCGSPHAYNYASAVSDGAIPAGWIRKYYDNGYRPQPGDVAVWGYRVGIAGPSGHVAVVVETDGDSIRVVDQSTDEQRAAALSGDIRAGDPSCYIVPAFNQAAQKAASPERYTVLVLDVSGPQTFEEAPNWMNVYGSNYTSDSSIESVKSAAQKYLDDARRAVGENYIAIVTYSESAAVVSGFTSDIDALQNVLDAIECRYERRSIYEGLECARSLLEGVGNENATKNLLLCTTGLTDCGEYDYEGRYGSDAVASSWHNKATQVKLYAYANPAVKCAESIRAAGTTLYVLGIFDPIEANIPSNSGVKDVAKFLRQTCGNLASSGETFFAVSDADSLGFVFGELHEDLTGSVQKRLYNDSDAYAGGASQDSTGGSFGLGGHYEEFLWGPALFEVPSTQLYRSSILSPESANYNLAMLSGCLCLNATNADYLWQSYIDLGFREENIYFYSYPDSPHNRSEAERNGKKFSDDEHLAFSIASLPMLIDGEKTDLLVITARGTVTFWEGIKDGTCLADKEFYGYTAWDWIYEFEEDIFAGLEDYHRDHDWLGTRPLKILVAGHSLGGAAANLAAAKLTLECGNGYWYAQNVTQDDIYAYTFGAIDSITDARYDGERIRVPVADGFSNIINIYNYMDTFGPDGKKLLTAKGNTMYGKFGNFYTFSSDMKGVVSGSADCMTHQIAGYVQALKSGWLTPEYKNGKIRVSIMCPVDVEIYDGDEKVCDIASDELLSAIPQIEVYIENTEKILLIPKDRGYRVVITATDAGSMDYMVQDLDRNDAAAAAYTGIRLEAGKIITSDIAEGASAAETALFVEDEKGARIAVLSADGSETGVEPEPADRESEKPGRSEAGAGGDEEAALHSLLIWIIAVAAAVIAAILIVVLVLVSKKRRSSAGGAGQKKKRGWIAVVAVVAAVAVAASLAVLIRLRTIIKNDMSDPDGSGGRRPDSSEEVEGPDAADPMETAGPEHRYAFVIDGCSWTEAQNKAIEAGGRLACFETPEEYALALRELDSGGHREIEYRIGARRELGSTKYYWTDADGRMYGDCLNGGGSYAGGSWAPGEPSYHWDEYTEAYLALYYDGDLKAWVWNDVADAVYGDDMTKYGYIIEYPDGVELQIPEASFATGQAGGGPPDDREGAEDAPGPAPETFSITKEELEAQVALIQECWFTPTEADSRAVVERGADGWDYSREYAYRNGALMFAFIYRGDQEEHRLYFKDGRMIRYIDENGVTYDYGELDPFSEWESRAAEEAESYRP